MRHLLMGGLKLLALCFVVGCASGDGAPATAIDLRIGAELAVPSELDRLTVSVPGQDTETDPSADLRDKPLPRSLRLVHEGGPLGPVRVSVRGWLGTTLVVEHDAVTAFRDGEVVALDVLLTRACVNVFCPGGSSCSEGTCEPIEVGAGGLDAGLSDASADDAALRADARIDGAAADGAAADAELPTSDAALDDAGGGLDAALSDASVDAGPRDAGVDAAAPDAALDAGLDAAVTPEAGAVDAGSDATAPADAGPVDAGAGAPPACSVLVPTAGDGYQLLASFAAQGTCSDPETGALSTGITWTSDRDGRVGTGASATLTLRSLGAHTLSLCAADPRNPALLGCASVAVTVTLTAQPTIAISALIQNGSATQPFSAGLALSATASVSGAGISVSWRDDLDGPLGSGLTLAIPTPHVGRHTLTAVATDRQSTSRTATRSYLVVLPGETNLVSPYGGVNAALARGGIRWSLRLRATAASASTSPAKTAASTAPTPRASPAPSRSPSARRRCARWSATPSSTSSTASATSPPPTATTAARTAREGVPRGRAASSAALRCRATTCAACCARARVAARRASWSARRTGC